jgi:hypothetical protein
VRREIISARAGNANGARIGRYRRHGRATPSAVGERQMLPVQTKSIRAVASGRISRRIVRLAAEGQLLDAEQLVARRRRLLEFQVRACSCMAFSRRLISRASSFSLIAS